MMNSEPKFIIEDLIASMIKILDERIRLGHWREHHLEELEEFAAAIKELEDTIAPDVSQERKRKVAWVSRFSRKLVEDYRFHHEEMTTRINRDSGIISILLSLDAYFVSHVPTWIRLFEMVDGETAEAALIEISDYKFLIIVRSIDRAKKRRRSRGKSS